VKDGQNNLNGRDALGWVNRNRDASAVVLAADPALFGDGDLDRVAVAGESFIDRVVDDFIDEVVKTTGTGGADVHSGAFTNRL
jgi:hypothetical protein